MGLHENKGFVQQTEQSAALTDSPQMEENLVPAPHQTIDIIQTQERIVGM